MKLVFIALAVLAVSFGSALPHHGRSIFGIKEDLNDFMALIPKDKVMTILVDYLGHDKEVQETLEYIMSDDFKSLLLDVEAIPEYRKFLEYLQDSGLNVYYYINLLHSYLGMPEYVPMRTTFSARRGVGVRGLLDDIKAILPLQKIKQLFYYKLEHSPAFINLIEKLRNDDCKKVVQLLGDNNKFQQLVQRARDQGVDVELIGDILNKIFGWRFEKKIIDRSLNDDLNDFLALVPKNEIASIAFDYLANDEEVQEVVDYFLGDDFKKLILDVDEVPEYIQLLNFLQSCGLDAYKAVNKLHDLLGLPNLTPPSLFSLSRRQKGVRGLINDIMNILPLEKMKALYFEKLQTSPEFANLVNVLKGDEMKQMVKQLEANPTFQDILARANSHGVPIDMIIDILNNIFGWGLEKPELVRVGRGLEQDLNDFIALIPKNEIVSIAFDYLANDDEVQELFEYVQGDDFKKLVVKVDHVPEYIQFLNFLQKTGLDVYKAVNELHDFLGLPNLTPPSHFSLSRRQKGVRGLINDIKIILPLEKIKALYYEKLQTSPEFANLINVLKGDEMKQMVKQLQANPTLQDFLAHANSLGVPIDMFIDMLNKIFGWGLEKPELARVSRSLQQDLNDFLVLVPQNEIVSISIDYLANDEEVQQVFEYIQGDDFKDLIVEVDHVPEYIEFLNFLQKSGLDVYKAVNALHDFLGLPNLTPPSHFRLIRRGKGVRGLIDEIMNALPLAKIQALYYEKLQTSPEFAELFNVLKGEEMKDMVKQLEANPTFQDIVARAKAHGVDIDLFIDILNKILGW